MVDISRHLWKGMLLFLGVITFYACPKANRFGKQFNKLHQNWKGNEHSKFAIWAKAEKMDQSWSKLLPDCPCQIEVEGNHCKKKVITFDTAEFKCSFKSGTLQFYHPGAEFELRQSKASQKQLQAKFEKMGQQCTYARKKITDKVALLITEGPAAGSIDKYGALLSGALNHRNSDVDPFCFALKLSGNKFDKNILLYLSARPTNKGRACAAFDPFGPIKAKIIDRNKNGIPDKWEDVKYRPKTSSFSCK